MTDTLVTNNMLFRCSVLRVIQNASFLSNSLKKGGSVAEWLVCWTQAQ